MFSMMNSPSYPKRLVREKGDMDHSTGFVKQKRVVSTMNNVRVFVKEIAARTLLRSIVYVMQDTTSLLIDRTVFMRS